MLQVHENKYYADLLGTRTTQQRIRLLPTFTAMGNDDERGIFDDMASIAPPVGRGWEYVVGSPADGAWDWDAELAEVADLLAEKLAAPTVEAGTYDLVIHPSNLWLTIHESIGHAIPTFYHPHHRTTELDRASATRRTTPARRSRPSTSSAPCSTARRSCTSPATAPSSTAWPPSGTTTKASPPRAGTSSSDGVLVGYQLDRPMAHLHPELNDGRSNGCAYADSPGHIPIQRMANVSLQPGRPTTSRPTT